MTNFWTIVEWLLYGGLRYVTYWIPLVTPAAVTRAMPWQWLLYNSVWDWFHRRANNGGPDEHWLNSWFEMCVGELLRLAEARAQPYVDAVKKLLLDRIGTIRPGFWSIASWVDWLQRAVGYFVPAWAGTIVGGLDILRDKLPAGIKWNWSTWDTIWEGIKSSVRTWAQDRFDRARTLAFSAFNWVVGLGGQLIRWRDRVSGFIDYVRYNSRVFVTAALGTAWAWLVGFFLNPRGVIVKFLGPDWPRVLAFARDCLDFYYALWSRGYRVLGRIVDDPAGWLYSKIEQMLVDRW